MEIRAAGELARGLALARQGQPDAAVACFRRAAQCAPNSAEVYNSLGAILADQGKLDEAASSFEHVVALRPDAAEAHYNLALALARADRLEGSLAEYARAIALKPDWAQAHNDRGAVLARQQKTDEAAAAYRQALALKPDYPEAYYNLGIVLKPRDLEAALDCYRRALALRPDYVDAHYNLAVALVEANRPREAADAYRRAIELKPDHVDAHLGYAIALLLVGRLADAWPEYEWRLRHPTIGQLPLEQPTWTGEPLAGRTILVRCEQGLGDALQFARYLPQVKAQGGTVLLQCRRPLLRLLASCAGVDAPVADDDPLPRFDVHVSLLSLPGIFGTTLATIPAGTAYLWPDAALVAQWKAELGADGLFKVGVAWRGSPVQPRDHIRSIPLEHFAPLARVPGVRLFSLQFGPGSEELAALADDVPIVDLGPRLGDFGSTAAIVRNLDLVISCDSSAAHLAGTLGVPVWVALAFAPDWRWMLDRQDSPWYPTARLFRQTTPGVWANVFAEMAVALAALRLHQS